MSRKVEFPSWSVLQGVSSQKWMYWSRSRASLPSHQSKWLIWKTFTHKLWTSPVFSNRDRKHRSKSKWSQQLSWASFWCLILMILIQFLMKWLQRRTRARTLSTQPNQVKSSQSFQTPTPKNQSKPSPKQRYNNKHRTSIQISKSMRGSTVYPTRFGTRNLTRSV